MKKFFVTNLFFLLALNILIKSFWILGIDRSVQNAVSAQDYGVYYALFNFTYLFNIILDFGIVNYNNRMIARHTNLLSKYFARIIPLKIILSLIYTVIVIVCGLFLGYDAWQTKMMFWMCLTQVLSSFISYFRSNITALMLFKTDSVISVLDRALLILFCSFMLWNKHLRQYFCIEYMVYVQFLTMFITFIVSLAVCVHKTGFIRLKLNKTFGFLLLKAGLPFAVLGLLMACYNRMDSVMLLALVEDEGVSSGIYASGFRLVDSANMVSYLFSVILLPLFSKLIKEKASENINSVITAAFHLILILTLGFVSVSLCYSQELMTLLYDKHIEESARVYRILSFCFIPISMTYIFGTLLTANGSLKYLNLVAGLGMLMNIGLNFILIPLFQQDGAATTSLITQSVTAILQAWLALKIFKIRFDWKYSLKILLYVLLVALISLGVLLGMEANWIIKTIVSLSLILAAAFAVKIFSFKDIKSLIS
ncbi:MAG: polysaccharide biosynthesis C-terminal domain-containing protein [Bacteroidales bacterium]|nr:polysaccharide biosynthesis C-terminal domain-containing protein [Bacteroidales bacterium]